MKKGLLLTSILLLLILFVACANNSNNNESNNNDSPSLAFKGHTYQGKDNGDTYTFKFDSSGNTLTLTYVHKSETEIISGTYTHIRGGIFSIKYTDGSSAEFGYSSSSDDIIFGTCILTRIK